MSNEEHVCKIMAEISRLLREIVRFFYSHEKSFFRDRCKLEHVNKKLKG